MKKIILLFVLILGVTQGVSAQENKSTENQRMGFAGLSIPLSYDVTAGGGIEVAVFKKWFGIGLQAEYLPATNIEKPITFARAFFLFSITDNFFIKTAGGIEARGFGDSSDSYNENFANGGFGPMFRIKRFYFGLQPNFTLSYEGIALSTLSINFGINFR